MPNELTVIGSNFSQAHQRRYLRCVDQHGRRWGVNIEIKNNSPTGPWEHFFVSPWVPEAKYIRHSNERPNRIWVDYDKKIGDLREAQKEWDKDLDREMRKRYREGDWRNNGRPIDADILAKVGERPNPVEPWVACKQGNRYALGLTDVVDERLRPYLPQKAVEELEIKEMDFSDADGPLAIEDEMSKIEREDAAAYNKAWAPGQARIHQTPATIRATNATVPRDALDDIFDVEALGGKVRPPKKGTPRPMLRKGKKQAAKQDLIDTDLDLDSA